MVFENIVGNMEILLGDPFFGVKEENRNVGLFGCLEGANNGKFFQFFTDFSSTADSCSINKEKFIVVVGDFNTGGITGSAGNIGNN